MSTTPASLAAHHKTLVPSQQVVTPKGSAATVESDYCGHRLRIISDKATAYITAHIVNCTMKVQSVPVFFCSFWYYHC